MNFKLHKAHQDLEDTHWWFVGRRSILNAVAKRFNLFSNECSVLDAGCGSGGTLRWLGTQNIKCFGFEPERWILKEAKNSGLNVKYGKLPSEVPLYNETFDVITLLDVLEHIENDDLSLDTLQSLLRPGGHLLITVPAFQFLWSAHDTLNNHFRRYDIQHLTDRLEEHGFKVRYASYYNTILFPAIAFFRKIRPNSSKNLHSTVSWINKILTAIFASESAMIRAGWQFPFGVSLVFVARKENDDANICSNACLQ